MIGVTMKSPSMRSSVSGFDPKTACHQRPCGNPFSRWFSKPNCYTLSMATLGTLEKVAVREAWPGEASDFTPWLSDEANLSLLGEEIGFDLELVETECEVGPYRADILAKRGGSDHMVVIENQFGKTDHGHLGQLLTYAAGVGGDGVGARAVIWIAERFSEPHRAALDWLNKCTEPGIGFFGVELQLWRIGDSPFAPKFNMVSRPNDWQKQLTRETGGLSESNQLYLDFWANFIAFCEQEYSTLPLPKDPPNRWWLPMSVGRNGFHVSLNARKKTKDLECQLWIDGREAKTAFSALLAQREKIVGALGSKIRFDDEAANRCKIYETSPMNVNSREEWPSINRWLKERGEAYIAFFTPLVKELTLR
jgi:Domain of unknown function (DUF4268)